MKVIAENHMIKISLDVNIHVKEPKKYEINVKDTVLKVIGKMFIDQDFSVRQIKFIGKA